MALRTRTKPREKEATQPLEELPDKAIRERIKDARRNFAELARTTDPAEVVRSRRVREVRDQMERLVEAVKVGEGELQRRQREELARTERSIPNPMLIQAGRQKVARQSRDRALRPLRNAVAFIASREHPTLKHSTLKVENLLGDDGLPSEQGLELVTLVGKLKEFGFGLAAEPLTDEELSRYEALVGIAAGEPELFERKRDSAAQRAQAREMAKQITRHPQGESLVAAVMSDPTLFDFLHERVRENMTLVDEYGRERKKTSVERILEPEHVATLFVLLSVISENGGREVRLTQHGAIRESAADGRLPFVDMKLLAQLRRNRFITTRREGSEIVVGPGERIRTVAEKWGISLP